MSPGFLKRCPPSPIINDSKRVRFAEVEDKNTSLSSFLGENSSNCEDSICTSTPVKYVKRPKSTKANQSTLRLRLSAIAESGEETGVADHESVDSGLGCSASNTMTSQPTVHSTKSQNSATSGSNKQKCLERSKISPNTIKKLKQFAFVERPTKKTESANDAQNSFRDQADEKCEKGNEEITKQPSTFRVEESLSGISTDKLSLTPVSNTNKPVSSENVGGNSLLRTRSPGHTIHHTDKRMGTGQLQRRCDFKSNSVNQNKALQTGSTNLSTGFSKLLTLCNKAKPFHTAKVPQNCTTTAKNKSPTLVRGNSEKTSSGTQKPKAKQTVSVNSLFTLNDEGSLSDIELEPDWGPATKKKKI